MNIHRYASTFVTIATGTCIGLLGLLLLSGCRTAAPSDEEMSAARKERLHGTFGTYAGVPRTPDGRVDVESLADDLQAIHAQTYNWLVWTAQTDWEDLQRFLPLARAKGIKVWVSLVPPSESPPRTKWYSEPFKIDYERWGLEIATLSLRFPNLVAWSIDDFSHNEKALSPERMRQILKGARQVNPKLAFVPCIYYRHAKPAYASEYRDLIDGVLFPYRHEAGEMNLSEYDTLEQEVRKLKELFGEDMAVFVDVYATKHSRLNDSSPEYVRAVMLKARAVADGVLIYCHQSKTGSPEKYAVIKELFTEWAR